MNKKELQELLTYALSSGADFADIFIEDTKSSVMVVNNMEVTGINQSRIYGVGVRLLLGQDETYGYTNDVTYDSIKNLITSLKASFNGPLTKVVPLKNKKPFTYDIKKPHDSVSKETKAKRLIELSKIVKSHDERIIQSIVNLIETKQTVLIANSKGVYQDDIRTYTRVVISAVSSDGTMMQQAFDGPGRFMGYEIFEEIDFDALAKEVATSAITLLNAEDMKPQVMPVVLHNAFGGVIFHEACGHPLEASAISKGLSPFTGKIGERIGSDKVTAYDDGNVDSAWGRLSFDDEGNETKKNLLIEKGILKGYLVDYKLGRKMKMASTGSGRRQSYKFSPTSRMNSTYIANGTDKFEDIIKDTKYGLFAKKLGGGTVVPATGEFNFAVMEGYLIEDGKITKPVRGAMLIGHGSDILFKIDKVADNLEFGQGMCGAQSGSIPVDVGQPTIRVSSMTVGGIGGSK